MGRGAERDMPLAREHAAGRIKRDPAGAGHIGLGPGMQVDHILGNALGPFDRLDVRNQLDRIARHEAGGKAQPAQQLHQQPGGIAARSGADVQRLLGRLHPRFHADDIADALLQLAVHIDQEVDRPSLERRMLRDQFLEQRPLRLDVIIGRQIGLQLLVIAEGVIFGIGFDEEVERVDDIQIGQQVDLDTEMIDRIGKDDPRQPVAVRVLLPVEEMVRRLDLQRIIGDLGATMRRGPQSYHLRTQTDRAAIAIGGQVVQRGLEHDAIRNHALLQCNAKLSLRQRFSQFPFASAPAIPSFNRRHPGVGPDFRQDSAGRYWQGATKSGCKILLAGEDGLTATRS